MTFIEKLLLTFEPTGIWLGSLLSLVLLGFYYTYFFYTTSYQSKPSLVPREEPPRQLSPAACRFLWIHDFDSDCLIAGIISAVVKDCYRIKWRNASFSIYINEHAIMDRLSRDEKAALAFNARHYLERLSISTIRNRFTSKAEDRMSKYLQKEYNRFLLPVTPISVIGLIFSLLGICITHLLFEPSIPLNIIALYYLIILPFAGIFSFLVLYGYHHRNWVALAISSAFMMGSLLVVFLFETSFEHYLLPPLLPLLLLSYFSFSYLPRHRAAGKEIVSQLEEFREFLIALIDTGRKLERSEYYLIPYMVALEVPFDNSQYFSPLLSEERRRNPNLPFSPI